VSAVEPTQAQVEALQKLPADQPVVMINLLAFKPDGGRESYERYAAEVVPHLQRVGGRPLYGGSQRALVVGDGDRTWWDTVIVVEYPSPGAFFEMVSDPGYLAVHAHREQGLERAELIATAAGF
jgi:uncharacterized protein (DUF1330 family)